MQNAINIPMANVAGVLFRPDLIICCDFRKYEAGDEHREIALTLMGPFEVFFEKEAADQFYRWYLEFTGQAKIVSAVPIAAPSTLSGH